MPRGFEERERTKVGWDDELRSLIKGRWGVGEQFTLEQVYEFEPELQRVHPANRHVRDKIRQVLQHLHDRGMIAFEDDHGTYRRRV